MLAPASESICLYYSDVLSLSHKPVISQSAQQTAMKAALHKGTKADVNIYSTGLVSSGLLGYATFPSGFDSDEDGVVFAFDSIPGGAIRNYNLGYTLVHEIGHCQYYRATIARASETDDIALQGLDSTIPSKAAAPDLETESATRPLRRPQPKVAQLAGTVS